MSQFEPQNLTAISAMKPHEQWNYCEAAHAELARLTAEMDRKQNEWWAANKKASEETAEEIHKLTQHLSDSNEYSDSLCRILKTMTDCGDCQAVEAMKKELEEWRTGKRKQ